MSEFHDENAMKSLRDRFARRAGLLVLILLPLMGDNVYGQGTFLFSNFGAPTHVGSLDGPVAGPNIYGQALVGLTPDGLVALGAPTRHVNNGVVFGIGISVPFAAPQTYVQVQMAAWDGALWGADYALVPRDQFGFTDIVPVLLTDPAANPDWPHFTRSAIVPVPEPSTWALVFFAALCIAVRAQGRCRLGLSTPAG